LYHRYIFRVSTENSALNFGSHPDADYPESALRIRNRFSLRSPSSPCLRAVMFIFSQLFARCTSCEHSFVRY